MCTYALCNGQIGNIFKEGELDKDSVCKESLLTASDGKVYKTNFYNLNEIIVLSCKYCLTSLRECWGIKVRKKTAAARESVAAIFKIHP